MERSEFAELAAFSAVAQALSFRRAAQRLGVSASALSHTIRALEERLDLRLLNRTTRSVALTDAGLQLLARVGPALQALDHAVADVNALRERTTGTVRINLPKLAADMVFRGRFGSFARLHPNIRLELTIDDGIADIVGKRFDAGIRPGELLQRDMVALRLTPELQTVVVASPAYLKARGIPKTPEALREHACIAYQWQHNGTLYPWHFRKRGKPFELLPTGSLTVNDVDVMIAAALDGAGLAFTIESQVATHVAARRLQRVLEDWCRPMPGFYLYYPSRRQLPPALRTLIDFLREDAARG
jgi:DNA-binding transcriptional LysR family regulator